MAMSKQDYIALGRNDFVQGARRIFGVGKGATNSWQENAYDEGYNAAAREAAVQEQQNDKTLHTAVDPSEPDHGACALAMHLEHLRTQANDANRAGDNKRRNRLINKVGELLARHRVRLEAVGIQVP